MHLCIWLALIFGLIGSTTRADEYPAGTLVPEVDLGLQPVAVNVPELFRGAVPDDLMLNLPPGFSPSIFAVEGLHKPRFMAFDENGVLHVANMGAREILALPDRNGDGVADESIVALSDLEESHSLVFYKGDLYVAEEDQIVRARDKDGDLVYEEREIFIANIPWEGWHDTRTLVVDEVNEKCICQWDLPAISVGWRKAFRSMAFLAS